MTIYVDAIRNYSKGAFCHMVTDQKDLAELHAMAKRIGLKREWFQKHPNHPHYDLMSNKRKLAIQYGAVEADAKQLLEAIRKRLE